MIPFFCDSSFAGADMKVLLITTTSNSVITFRKSLIEYLKNAGNDIVVASGDNFRAKDIEELGASFILCKSNNRSINPFDLLKYKKQLKTVINKEKPDIVFTFQLKPNLFGARFAGNKNFPKIYAMVEGAGDVFVKEGLVWKCIRTFVKHCYKKSFKKCSRVFFLNNDDKNLFIRLSLLDSNKAIVIKGIGVDLDHFSFSPVSSKTSFLMIARMLKTKGVLDYCNCARIVKKSHPEAVFNYLGSEGDLTIKDIKEFIDDGSINYCGTSNDTRQYFRDCLVFVLPSFYGEGLPMSIMEAQSIGRSVITTNNVGCKETVVDGFNGFLVEKHDISSLVDRCIYALEHPEQMGVLGVNARKFAEDNWDCRSINSFIYKIITDNTY